jgi:hypothetical protein
MGVAGTLFRPPNLDLDTCIFTLLIDKGGKSTKLIAVPWNCLNPHSFRSSTLLCDVEGDESAEAIGKAMGGILQQADDLETHAAPLAWNFSLNGLVRLTTEVLLCSAQFLAYDDMRKLVLVSHWFHRWDKEVERLAELKRLEDTNRKVPDRLNNPVWEAKSNRHRVLAGPTKRTRKKAASAAEAPLPMAQLRRPRVDLSTNLGQPQPVRVKAPQCRVCKEGFSTWGEVAEHRTLHDWEHVTRREASPKKCRWGKWCRRADCHFWHSERADSSQRCHWIGCDYKECRHLLPMFAENCRRRLKSWRTPKAEEAQPGPKVWFTEDLDAHQGFGPRLCCVPTPHWRAQDCHRL